MADRAGEDIVLQTLRVMTNGPRTASEPDAVIPWTAAVRMALASRGRRVLLNARNEVWRVAMWAADHLESLAEWLRAQAGKL